MKITEADVAHVAKLANLEVPEADRKELAQQLDRIVSYVEQLNALDVAGIEPMTEAVLAGKRTLREDRAVEREGGSEAGRTVKLFKDPKVITER
jgi:aspartyl-tRNA(Asn)/glutamyl-tRNA(Gln) amidotransferase subunit C